jgi:hypothetical protein
MSEPPITSSPSAYNQNTPSEGVSQSRHQKYITGAIVDQLDETLNIPDPLPSPLPMTVWLRGDESYCGDFSLNAEAVMAHLGIKRTRLTQISGRELRVGRIKKGRYVVPVYRPDDVAEYLSWSRATATHLKSTQVVQDATSDLRDAATQIFTKMESTLNELSEGLAHDILTRVAGPLSKMLVYELKPFTDKTQEKYSKEVQYFYHQLVSQSLGASEDLKHLILKVLEQLREQSITSQMMQKSNLECTREFLERWLHQVSNLLDHHKDALLQALTERDLKTHQLLLKSHHQIERVETRLSSIDKNLGEILEEVLTQKSVLENSRVPSSFRRSPSDADRRRIKNTAISDHLNRTQQIIRSHRFRSSKRFLPGKN